MLDAIASWLDGLGLSQGQMDFVEAAMGLAGIALVALILNFLAKQLIKRMVNPLIRRSRTEWDDVLLEHKVFVRLSHLAPAILINWLAPVIFAGREGYILALGMAVNIYLVVIFIGVVCALLNAAVDFYKRSDKARRIPLKGFVQGIKLVLYLIGLILILSIAFDKSPLYFFSGLGALTAVLLLVFKDAILGMVAGIEISVNNLVKVGDWVEMPKYQADGDVVDVTLTMVKVQNWDKTITNIPSYALISNSFKNWRGMSESGGRRIKRSLHVDMNSIGFVDNELLDRFRRYELLRPYLDEKVKEVDTYNKEKKADLSEMINGRRITNIGTFRAYCVAYLRSRPDIHKDRTFLIRQLEPTSQGLPLEIYVFCKDIRWVYYEGIQSDIFDHLLAVIPQFDLKVYQRPSGKDLENLKVGETRGKGSNLERSLDR